MMRRSEVADCLAESLSSTTVVVCSLGTARRAWAETNPEHPTYYASDPMGLAPSIALGLALSREDRDVCLLEGDGDLLMNLGVLTAITDAQPQNLRIVVFCNRRYETGGGMPLPGRGAVDIPTAARATGFGFSAWVDDDLSASIDSLLAAPGPGLLAVEIEAEESPYGGYGPTSQAEDRAAFMARLRTESFDV